MDYTRDVEKDAVDFLSDIEEDIKAAIINGEEDVSEITCEESGYGEIRDFFHEQVIDRSYTIEDAAFIVSECEDEETDTGIWEGLEMHEAMQACAAYSYGNDVWNEVESQYEGLLGEFEPSYLVVDEDDNTVKEFTEDGDAEDWIESQPGGVRGLWVKEGRGNIDEIWQDWADDNTVHEIETGGRDELFALKRWVKLNAKAGTWGGYPLSSSYIDDRCGAGYSMPDVKDFVTVDHETGRKLPHMRGMYLDAVKERIEELEGTTGAPVRLTVELEADTEDEIITRLQHIGERIGEGDTGSHDWKIFNRGGA